MPVWGSDAEESPRSHTSIPDSDDEQQRLLTRQMDDAQAAALTAARNGQGGRSNAMANPARLNPGGVYRLVPQLMPGDAPRVALLAADLFRETRGRGLFADFPQDEFPNADEALVRYRIHSLEVLR